MDGRPLTNICLTNSPLTLTTRREFTGPRGEPREKSIIKRRHVRSDEKGSGSSSVHCAASSSRFSSKDLASRSEARPALRLGPCFKISSLLFLVILALFFTSSIMALNSGHNQIFSMNCRFAVCRSIDKVSAEYQNTCVT